MAHVLVGWVALPQLTQVEKMALLAGIHILDDYGPGTDLHICKHLAYRFD